jgi:hypothetical protein
MGRREYKNLLERFFQIDLQRWVNHWLDLRAQGIQSGDGGAQIRRLQVLQLASAGQPAIAPCAGHALTVAGYMLLRYGISSEYVHKILAKVWLARFNQKHPRVHGAEHIIGNSARSDLLCVITPFSSCHMVCTDESTLYDYNRLRVKFFVEFYIANMNYRQGLHLRGLLPPLIKPAAAAPRLPPLPKTPPPSQNRCRHLKTHCRLRTTAAAV